MTAPPPLSPSRHWGSIVVVWFAAVLCAVAIGVFARPDHYAPLLSLAVGVCVVGSLCVQLATQEKRGFVNRLIGSVTGAIVVLAVASLVLGLVALGR